MHIPLGEYIRDLRRQRSMTQTELGGEQFSKSYVSAVERDKIAPSYEAVRFFATQLGQPAEEFEQLLKQTLHLSTSHSMVQEQDDLPDVDTTHDVEVIALLDLIIRGKDFHQYELSHVLSKVHFTLDAPANLQKQARYAFLQGLIAQEQGDHQQALAAFEYALALAPQIYHPAILDALGTHFYLTHAFESALAYYLRALEALTADQQQDTDLELHIQFHNGKAYQALGRYLDARTHYEHARRLLRANHNLRLAGELYLGLGYSTYASIHSSPPKDAEHSFQHALSYLLQSRTLYQVSSDPQGASSARLTQAMVLLDYSSWRKKMALAKSTNNSKRPIINCSSLLDEAEEQCRQVLLTWQETVQSSPSLSADVEKFLYVALAYLIRTLNQRAAIARLSHYGDTSLKERALAIHLTQHIVSSLQADAFPSRLLQDAVSLPGTSFTYRSQSQSIPPQLDFSLASRTNLDHPIIRTELAFAFAEVSEEIASATQTKELYALAEQYFQLAISSIKQTQTQTYSTERDPGYLNRAYLLYVQLLEQRLQDNESTSNTVLSLLEVCKDALAFFTTPSISTQT